MAVYDSLICDDEERRQQVIEDDDMNGIDYIEVPAASLDAQRFLHVYFLTPLTLAHSDQLVNDPGRFTIGGGVRVTDIRVLAVTQEADHLVVEVDRPGDFSPYTLTISAPWIDPAFASKEFSFKAGCPSDFDCQVEELCPEEEGPSIPIDYLAKDYASFRRALLDLIPTLAPDWLERHPADMGMALIEVLAYAADHLSYYQDAVANEAYLETARQRISVRRHARLIDYQMHDGASARAFIHVRAKRCSEADPADDCRPSGVIPAGTPVLSRITQPIGAHAPGAVISSSHRTEAQDAAAVVFETMEDVYVDSALNAIELYPWGNRRCCLPRGTTTVDLKGNLTWDLADPGGLVARLRDQTDEISRYIFYRLPVGVRLLIEEYSDGDPVDDEGDLHQGLLVALDERVSDPQLYNTERFAGIDLAPYLESLAQQKPAAATLRYLNRRLLQAAYPDAIGSTPRLQIGDYLLFEEILGPETGREEDADLAHRQVVRLTGVERVVDPLHEQEVTRVTWGRSDALTFPLCLSALVPAGESNAGEEVKAISVARGNLVLADHGRTIREEEHVDALLAPRYERQRRPHRFFLGRGPLSFRIPLPDAGAPAASLFTVDAHAAQAQIARLAVEDSEHADEWEDDWQPVPHLLDSDAFDRHFVVETDNDGRPLIRFGDGYVRLPADGDTSPIANRIGYGQAPPDGVPVKVTYRIGVGRAGNVGANTLHHLIKPEEEKGPDTWPTVACVDNPLPAWGGVDPEPIEEVKQNAPAAFQTAQRRAVTEEDYALAAERHPEVARAVATFRWTGSWHTVFVTVDPVGRTDVDLNLQRSVRAWVQAFTQAGYDLEVAPPVYVPLDIEIEVCVEPTHFRAHVRAALLEALSSRQLPGGRRGFFHPDNFTFNQPLYLSQLYAAVEAVEGVDSAEVTGFHRFGRLPDNELQQGYIPIGRLEVARLDNDPNFPEHGVLRLTMLGGK